MNDPSQSPFLSIVIPVYNEEKTLEEIITRVHRSCGDFSEVIIVDDGSKDSSLEIIRKLARHGTRECRDTPQDTVLTKENGGKGSAVRMGYAQAKGKYVIVQDADLEYDPEEIPELVKFAEENDHKAVYGSRRLKKQKQFTHLLTFLGGTVLTYIFNILYFKKLSDQPTCYKMVRNDVLKTLPLKENDFRYDPEITALLARKKIHIAEFPISYHPRSYKEGKKICWKDWFKWCWVFLKLRFVPIKYLT
ncbi:MAG: glycosyltransferase family 2 protein [Candidatus Peribacteraceae bacterium]|jgi:glycosyltransferase involved in cell wall biosynthesis|nr:glycosyltransferase family 2 protein [Candidatus Peribacteraceae bacterium]MDP7453989.1 glycosyltransferase family 2 protein [Candidatus Peribacteraceae bacterium]MDP7646308.1 glycosyltransferase family 2 protein [Candidatus Peribacteraceae bacterium]|tara:strand:+ start:616 stop:1359 length:744 start_codon:yes stop_codon:yes gene_type:complete